jgi:hypothetical protein
MITSPVSGVNRHFASNLTHPNLWESLGTFWALA